MGGQCAHSSQSSSDDLGEIVLTFSPNSGELAGSRARAMKLRDWMKEEGHTDVSFAEAVSRHLSPPESCSPRAVEKWRNGSRIPRKRMMPLIGKVTSNRVSPSDFFEIDRTETLRSH